MKSERRRKLGERKEKVLICALLFATLAFISVGCASADMIYVNPGESIQTAVNAAAEDYAVSGIYLADV
ncbi:MAG: hypothetical protein KAV25_06090 [Methanophagales archaeon]|nr:hypothetical protein [Methanophagales archaeon]